MKIMNEEGLMIQHLEEGQIDFNDEKIEDEFVERLNLMLKTY